MFARSQARSTVCATFAGLALFAMFAQKRALGDSVTAGVDAFATLPPVLGGTTGITVPGLNNGHPISLEGANEAQFCNATTCIGGSPFPQLLTQPEIMELGGRAPSLAAGLIRYQVVWVDPDGAVVGPTSQHAVGTSVIPVLNPAPNFDTVVERMNSVPFTAAGQSKETPVDILMLNLESVDPVLIGGFHYELFVKLANGSPVDTQEFTGNLKLTATSIDSSGVHGTMDLGVTGPTPTSANLGANLPAGMFGLPVSYAISFLPLDGGPGLNSMPGEIILQNPTLGSFAPVPEPSSVILFGSGIIGLLGYSWLRRMAKLPARTRG